MATYSYKEYQEGDAVKQAQAALQQQLANKPGEYQSQWQRSLDEAMKKILNREKFSYDLNGDALYQQYKDRYIQQGQMAMQDTMGQAAALTGGYGNSYAQGVGQQTYQGYLQGLNDKVPELYRLALDKYNQETSDLYNQYSLLGQRENQDYGRYRDTVSDWNTERDYLTNRYDSERSYDYGKYSDERDFGYRQYQDEVAKGQWEKEFEEARRQFNAANGIVTEGGSGGSSGGSGSGSGNGSGSGSGGSNYNNEGLTREQVKALQQAMGMNNADGYSGTNTQAAFGSLGYGSATEAYNALVVNGGKKKASYNFGELMDAAASGMSKAQIEAQLKKRGVNTSDPLVQADIKKALSK